MRFDLPTRESPIQTTFSIKSSTLISCRADRFFFLLKVLQFSVSETCNRAITNRSFYSTNMERFKVSPEIEFTLPISLPPSRRHDGPAQKNYSDISGRRRPWKQIFFSFGFVQRWVLRSTVDCFAKFEGKNLQTECKGADNNLWTFRQIWCENPRLGN